MSKEPKTTNSGTRSNFSSSLGFFLAAIGGVAGVATLMFTGVITYGQSRIAMWHNPWLDAQGDGYQLVQSLLAIGSGGLLGVGLGKSRQKFLYLPEEHNDFIFAIVTVHHIVDSDKSYVMFREIIICVMTYRYIVSS